MKYFQAQIIPNGVENAILSIVFIFLDKLVNRIDKKHCFFVIEFEKNVIEVDQQWFYWVVD